MKFCNRSTCTQANPQPLENFHHEANGKFGRASKCKVCKRELARAARVDRLAGATCSFNPCARGRDNITTGLCAGHQRQRNKGYELRPILESTYNSQKIKGDTKWCRICERWLPLEIFSPAKHLAGGKAGMCRRCDSCRRYNITALDYERMLAEQGGGCKICLHAPETKPLVVDHDHKCCPSDKSCGKCTRGLLCGGCNSAIGMFEENEETLLRAINYLKEAAHVLS